MNTKIKCPLCGLEKSEITLTAHYGMSRAGRIEQDEDGNQRVDYGSVFYDEDVRSFECDACEKEFKENEEGEDKVVTLTNLPSEYNG